MPNTFLTSLSLRLSSPVGSLGALVAALAMVAGCSSSPAPAAGCTSGETSSCTCAGGDMGTRECGSEACVCGGGVDSGAVDTLDAAIADAPSVDTPGDATHKDDQNAPTTTYGACAVSGSFGWPCSLTVSGADTAECTDPNFPYCFVGGQGAWCTASCATFGVCPGADQDAGDAGCVPTACNARGYCK